MLDLRAPEPINSGHILDTFCSGEPSLDSWLKTRSLPNHASGATRTFVLCSGNTVLGYYALSTGAISKNESVGKFRRNMPDSIPVILIARLAVDEKIKGIGAGRGLLKDAVGRISQAADVVGVRGVVVHAISEDARRFYEHLGFRQSPVNPMTLMITLQDIKLAMGVISREQ